jgi:hypothetical protein
MRALLFMAVLPLAACSSGTTLLVELSAAPGTAVASVSVDVRLKGTDLGLSRGYTFDGGSLRLPATLVIELPDSGPTVVLTARGLDGDGRVLVASQEVRAIPHQQLLVTLVLGQSVGDSDGSVDLSAQDGSFDAGPSSCPSAGLLFCDGFEAPSLDLSSWSRQLQGAASIDTDSSRAYRGGQSLHAHVDPVPAGGLSEAAAALLPFVELAPSLYVRVFVFLPSTMPAAGASLLTLTQSMAPFGNLGLFYEQGPHPKLHDFVSPVTASYVSATAFPVDRWVCLEWQIGASPAQTSLSVDGAPVSDLQGVSYTAPSGNPLHRFEVDLQFFKPPISIQGYDVWYDELAISNNPIGCTQ